MSSTDRRMFEQSDKFWEVWCDKPGNPEFFMRYVATME